MDSQVIAPSEVQGKSNQRRAPDRRAAPLRIPAGLGRSLVATPIFDTYWQFAVKRQELFMQRAMGEPPPWTDDAVLSAYRFTNPYRAADRVSQYLIRKVIYRGKQDRKELFFRILLFKLFNRVETWERLVAKHGTPTWKTFNAVRYSETLDEMMARGERVYSAAYIMPSPAFGNSRKHKNHLHLIEHMMRDGAPRRVARAKSLSDVFDVLQSYPSFGAFLAFQFAIDLNYSEMIDFSEMAFVVAGPGAKGGIRKCFVDTAGFSDADVIRIVAERANDDIERLGLAFRTLWGRALQLIDCQNLFCEVDKYSRVVHPEVIDKAGRTRIKQKFTPNLTPLPQWYPPKWGVHVPATSQR